MTLASWSLGVSSVKPGPVSHTSPQPGFRDGRCWHIHKPLVNTLGAHLLKAHVKYSRGPTEDTRKVLSSQASALMHRRFYHPTRWFSLLKCESDLLFSCSSVDLKVCVLDWRAPSVSSWTIINAMIIQSPINCYKLSDIQLMWCFITNN